MTYTEIEINKLTNANWYLLLFSDLCHLFYKKSYILTKINNL